MEAGIEIYNNNNKLVINSTFKNLVFSRKIKVSDLSILSMSSIYNHWSPSGYEIAQFAMPSLEDGEEIFAFAREGTGDLTIAPWINADLTPDARVIQGDYTQSFDDVYMYIFSFKPIEPGAQGLQVFDASGNTIFDSAQKYMKVLYSGALENYAVPINKKYAICPMGVKLNAASYRIVGQTQTPWFDLDVPGISGGKVVKSRLRAYDYQVNNPNRPPFAINFDLWSYMLIDVTNY